MTKALQLNPTTGAIREVDIVEGGGGSMPPLYTRREMQFLKNPGLTTTSLVGIPTAPTNKTAGTIANGDDADSPWLNMPTTAVSGNASGFLSAFTIFRRDWETEFVATLKTDPTLLTTSRYWAGIFSADPSASDAPNIHAAAFRYATSADGTAFWRAVTIAGTGASATVTTTTTAIAVNTKYLLRIVCSNTTNDVKFYINDVLVATHTTTLPTATQLLGYGLTLTTLSGSARTLKWGRVALLHD